MHHNVATGLVLLTRGHLPLYLKHCSLGRHLFEASANFFCHPLPFIFQRDFLTVLQSCLNSSWLHGRSYRHENFRKIPRGASDAPIKKLESISPHGSQTRTFLQPFKADGEKCCVTVMAALGSLLPWQHTQLLCCLLLY